MTTSTTREVAREEREEGLRRDVAPCLPRREWLLSSASLALTARSASAAKDETKGTPPTKLLCGPSLTAPSDNEVYVWWHVDSKTDRHRVEYGPTPSLGKIVNWETLTRSPSLPLKELTPGARVYYRVTSDNVSSPVLQFQLPGQSPSTRLCVWGDNQGGHDVFARQTVPAVRAAKPGLILVAGDLVDMGFRYADWNRDLYGPGGELFRSIPWYPVRGNHDGEFPLSLEMLRLPGSNRWYARTQGPVRYVILDTNVYHRADSDQFKWLESEVKGVAWKKARHRIVSFHHPPFNTVQSSPGDDGAKLARAVLVPLLERAGADAIICGHAHVYERGARPRPDGGVTNYLVTGGGGGKLDRLKTGDWPFMTVSHRKHHVLVADIADDAIDWKSIDTSNGEVLDSFKTVGKSLAS